jgi:type I restriction enzyme R subunit
MSFTESIVEDAALSWFSELGYSLLHGQEITPGEVAAERANFNEAFLPGRLQAALKKLNPRLRRRHWTTHFAKLPGIEGH